MISCLASTPQVALGISAPLIIPMLLFGGFFLQNDSVPVYLDWIKYVSWFMYGNEALSINQWRGVTFNSTYCDLLANISSTTVTTSPSLPSVTLPPLLPSFVEEALKDIGNSIICTGEDILERYNFNPVSNSTRVSIAEQTKEQFYLTGFLRSRYCVLGSAYYCFPFVGFRCLALEDLQKVTICKIN